MTVFANRAQGAESERRAQGRVLVDCTARLLMPSGRKDGRLVDLSLVGAQLEVSDPPLAGSWAMLEWQGPDDRTHEAYAQVAWARDGKCGLRFERAIARATMEASGEIEHTPVRPSANHQRIQLGQKRSQVLAKHSYPSRT